MFGYAELQDMAYLMSVTFAFPTPRAYWLKLVRIPPTTTYHVHVRIYEVWGCSRSELGQVFGEETSCTHVCANVLGPRRCNSEKPGMKKKSSSNYPIKVRPFASEHAAADDVRLRGGDLDGLVRAFQRNLLVCGIPPISLIDLQHPSLMF